MITKKIIVPALVVATLGAGAIFTTSIAQAVDGNPASGLIQFISQKLGIDQSKVQSAVNEYRTQERSARQQQNTADYTTYLDGLVSEGKITSAQKAALLAKHNELQQANQSTAGTSTPEERRTLMDKQRTELESWAKSQGIDVSYLRFGFGGGMRGAGRMGRMMDLE